MSLIFFFLLLCAIHTTIAQLLILNLFIIWSVCQLIWWNATRIFPNQELCRLIFWRRCWFFQWEPSVFITFWMHWWFWIITFGWFWRMFFMRPRYYGESREFLFVVISFFSLVHCWKIDRLQCGLWIIAHQFFLLTCHHFFIWVDKIRLFIIYDELWSRHLRILVLFSPLLFRIYCRWQIFEHSIHGRGWIHNSVLICVKFLLFKCGL